MFLGVSAACLQSGLHGEIHQISGLPGPVFGVACCNLPSSSRFGCLGGGLATRSRQQGGIPAVDLQMRKCV